MQIYSNIWTLICLFTMQLYSINLLPKTILVTGGAGFIGSHVAQKLIQRGDKVIIVDNFNDYYNLAIKYNKVS